ncbi:MAG: nucleotidyltransferase family protein [Anaerosomatales bacterium]|nr:nucleotidyltransferase family protein [Anaerosomatales bacterium]
MLDAEAVIALLAAHASEVRRRYGVSRFGVFGSFARGDAAEDSDLDVFVEFSRPTFRNYMGLKQYLQELTGLTVDLVCVAALSPALERVVKDEVRYVA